MDEHRNTDNLSIYDLPTLNSVIDQYEQPLLGSIDQTLKNQRNKNANQKAQSKKETPSGLQ